MERDPSSDITRLLHEVGAGNKRAEAELIALVYKDLRRMAARYMRGEAGGHTLQTTALVHEAYLRLARPTKVDWQNRAHFFAVAATVMRRILVDHARARNSERRGGTATVSNSGLLDTPALLNQDPAWVEALDEALTRLAALDERQSRIVELRFFAGLTVEETAEALNVSPRTIKREWQLAKAWLYGELTA